MQAEPAENRDFFNFLFSKFYLGGTFSGSSHIKSGRLQAKSPTNAGFSIFFYSLLALKFV